MKTRIDQSGLVVESDYISLSTSLKLENYNLHDSVVKADHKIHPDAMVALERLRQGCAVNEWLKFCFKNGLSNENAEEILLFLNSIGGLRLKRSLVGHMKHALHAARLLLWGIKPLSMARRYPVSLLNLSAALWRAMTLLVCAVIFVAVLAYGANMAPEFIMKTGLFFIAAIYISTLAHEAMHARVIGKNASSMMILQRGLRIGILHRSLPFKVELYSAITGPLAGAATAALTGVLSNLLWPNSGMLAIGLLVAGMHILSWLPGYGDGAVVWHRASIRQIQEETR